MTTPRLVFLDAGTIGDDIQWPNFSDFGEVINYDTTPPDKIVERVAEADFILTNKVYLTAEHIAAARNLRYPGSVAP